MPPEAERAPATDIAALIRRETAALNAGDLDAWMALFTDDGYYWMPLEPEHESPDEHDSLIYDNRPLMEIRRNNLGHPLSPSMDFPVRSVRILSELEITSCEDPAGDYAVSASVIAVISHRRQDVFAGHARYRVRRVDSAWRICSKRVDLLNADRPLDTIMMYI